MNKDTPLVQRAAGGDPAAFEQLVLAYQKPVYNLALRLVANPDDAFDLTQEAFLRAWRKLDTVRAEEAFSAWLYRLTYNVCLDFLRTSKRRKAVSLTVSDEESDVQLDVPDPAPDPETAMLRAADQAAVAQAMNQLAAEYRQILTLRIINDLSYQEIGEILGVAEGTVKSRLSRARQSLRKKLLQTGNLPSGISSKKTGRRGRNGL